MYEALTYCFRAWILPRPGVFALTERKYLAVSLLELGVICDLASCFLDFLSMAGVDRGASVVLCNA